MYTIDLFFTNKPKSFVNIPAIGLGWNDYHKLIPTFSTIKIETKENFGIDLSFSCAVQNPRLTGHFIKAVTAKLLLIFFKEPVKLFFCFESMF